MIASRALRTGLLSLLGATSFFSGAGDALAQTSTAGQWTKAQSLPFAPIHNVYLPNGKLMLWGTNGGQSLWDPVTQQVSSLPSPGFDVFCAGHVQLPDGRVLVAGGHIQDFVGLPRATVYDPTSNSWSAVPNMNAGRWYPTLTTLPNGDVLVVSGSVDNTVGSNPLPQVYQPATNNWRNLTGAQLTQELYPMMFVAPNGRVIEVGPNQASRWLDTTGTGSWSPVATRNHGWRDYGTAAMYADGKILVVGGGDPPQASAEVIDLNAATPAWRSVGSMSTARRHLNSTVLPDGSVLVTGGTSGAGFNNASGAVLSAELWNPDTESWTTMASGTVPRLYHSGAVLLLDGRVVLTGGDGQPEPEIFSPPYLFKGARPTLGGVPTSVAYGQRFSVQSPESAGIRKVTLIRLSSATHAFNMNQRLNVLQFTAGTGALEITAPANGNLAPPGTYMLFLVDSTGVPSVGSMVQLGGTAAPQPPPAGAPTVSSVAPTSATAGGPAFTLTVNGTNFVAGSTVRWNGAARTTTFVSAAQVTAAIPAADIASAGTVQVSVLNPDGSASGTAAFTVSAGGTANCTFPAWVQGRQYAAGSIVSYNGALYVAKFANPGYNPTISTYYWAPYQCGTTTPTTGTPAVSSLAPTSATAGGAAFTLTVNGSNFVSGSTVRWNGTARTTTFVGASRVTAAIPAADIGAAGTAQISVLNPGGAVSGNAAFTVSAPAAGTCTYPAWVQGRQYAAGSIVSYNGVLYIAKFANPGYNPTISTYYWAPYSC